MTNRLELFPSKEARDYTYTLIDPNGNLTALVKGIQPSLESMKTINNELMKPGVIEQVGFYEQTGQNTATLRMAGGELCVNALRALAFLILQGQPGEVTITAEPNLGTFSAGVTNNSQEQEAWIELPLPQSNTFASEIFGTGCFEVPMSGITHLVVPSNTTTEIAYQLAMDGLSEANLIDNAQYPAAGVMFYQLTTTTLIELYPIVWVRDVKTLVAENACGSGTLAAVAALLQQKLITTIDSPVLNLQVKQTTSNEVLTVTVDQSRQSAIISGRTNWVTP